MPKQHHDASILEEGWIKLHRSVIKHPVFQDSELLHLFLYCLIRANHTPQRFLWNGRELTMERGQFTFGRKQASKATRIKQSTVYRKMMTLKNLEIIDIQSNNKFSTVTVLNYGKYQDVPPQVEQQQNAGMTPSTDEYLPGTQIPNSEMDTSLSPVTSVEFQSYDEVPLFAEHQNGQQLDNNRTTSEQQPDTNKNVKNEKNDKKKECHSRTLQSGRKVFSLDSIEYELSKLLLTEIRRNDRNFLSNSPAAEEASLQRWALHIDRLVRLDNRPPEEIRQVIAFAQTSSFWRSNILSAGKLREKYTTLLLQMKSRPDESARQPAKTTNEKVHPCEILI